MTHRELICFLKEKNNDLYQTIRMSELLDQENDDITYITGDSKEELIMSLFKNVERLFGIFFPEFIFEGGDVDNGGRFYIDETFSHLETWVGIKESKDENFYSKFILLETYFNNYFEVLNAKILEKFGYKVSSKMDNNNDIQLRFRFLIDN